VEQPTVTAASFNGLLIVTAVALAAPLVVATVSWLKVPSVVLEIVAGIIVGPAVLGWVKIGPAIQILAIMGLAFLLFLAGLEIDLGILKGHVLHLTLAGFAATMVLGFTLGLLFHAIGWVRSPFFLAVALAATSLGLVIPVLRDAGLSESPSGRFTIAGATVAEFGAVLLLSLFFSESKGGAASKLVTVGIFAAFIVAVSIVLLRAGRSIRLDMLLTRLQDTTAEIRVRAAVVLLIGFVALAAKFGLETVLGAFVAGAVLNIVDKDSMSHPQFRVKLDAIGYGFLIPVFFVFSGLTFDLHALINNPWTLLRVPVLLAALFIARGIPALIYVRSIGPRSSVVAGLLQATSLPFIVTATTIGVAIGAVRPVTAAALVAAGLLSVVLFPLIALAIASPAGLPDPSTAPAVIHQTKEVDR
jgi:Kef-type K+ transport system membrane component KefB